MLKSRLTRILVLGAAAASLTGIAATGAQAVTYYTQPAGPGACYLPKDVAYAGQQASITAPSMQVNSPFASTVTVREWIFIVDAVTGARMRQYWAGDRNLAAGGSTTFPTIPLDLSFRTPSTFFWAAIQEQIEVYSNGSLLSVGTFTPSGYRIFTNSGFYSNIDTGRYQSSC